VTSCQLRRFQTEKQQSKQKLHKVEAKKPIIDPVAAQKRVFSNVN
jgi:hypothetical protein